SDPDRPTPARRGRAAGPRRTRPRGRAVRARVQAAAGARRPAAAGVQPRGSAGAGLRRGRELQRRRHLRALPAAQARPRHRAHRARPGLPDRWGVTPVTDARLLRRATLAVAGQVAAAVAATAVLVSVLAFSLTIRSEHAAEE